MFQFVAEAYEVLTDDEKRKNYDIYGTPTSTTGGQSTGPHRPHFYQNYSAEELYTKIFKEAGIGFKFTDIYHGVVNIFLDSRWLVGSGAKCHLGSEGIKNITLLNMVR